MLYRLHSLLIVLMLAVAPVPALAAQSTLVTPSAPLPMTGLAAFINSALQSIGSQNSGATAPANGTGGAPFAGEAWCNTTSSTWVCSLYDGSSWNEFGTVDSSGHRFTPYMGTAIVSGGVPYGASAGTIGWSSALTLHGFVFGGGAGGAPTSGTACTSAQIPIGQTSANPACETISGDVTVSSSGVTALGNIPTGATMAGNVLATTSSAPSTPASGKIYFWFDSVNLTPSAKRSDGTLFTMVATGNGGSAHQWLSSFTGAGIPNWTQPAFSDISGTAPNSQLANMAAWTLKGNNTSGSAAPGDFTIDALTNKASPVSADEVPIWDSVALAMKKTPVSALASAGSVASLGGLTGAISVGTGIACSGSSCTGTTVGGLSGAVTFDKGLACSGSECKLSLANVSLQATPSLPSATASTTGVMAGFGSSCAMTPAFGTRVAVNIEGTTSPNVANIVSLLMKFGTGTAPTALAAATGTSVGSTVQAQSATNAANLPFHLSAVITGLTPGTAYWFDLDEFVNTGNNQFVTGSVSCNGHEF